MPYELKPHYNEPRILLGRYYGHVSLEDVQGINDTAIAYYEAVEVDKVHVLIDFSEIETHENKLRKLLNAAQDSMTHSRVGWWVVWGINRPLVSFLIHMAARITRIRFKEVQSQDEALKFIDGIIGNSKAS